ncbi:ATP-binding protein [Chitinophaga arvensicola]|uniref:Histidine kinase-, DNA gyrase B-, and HSP90-like ATPase n=1 Tax=Chitinophaga arvensicola TaxID=29529 RepID=A0A1I0S5J2_9BACT|nr:ATP-binding protein [Chitinophaga arvensicola]SEW49943.1 Histidine kinase-, DNA gyrase B-, and HSP90-like ATPase [Chitinophaga arvensicola]
MSQKHHATFADRFLESFVGSAIFCEPKVAIIELIANAWDAGSTEVNITWPESDGDRFEISDNGHGMTEGEFESRFMVLAYDRIKDIGGMALIPPSHRDKIASRPAFGKNGKGRMASFAFGNVFTVSTSKNNLQNTYDISIDGNNRLTYQKIETKDSTISHGTTIFIKHSIRPQISIDDIKKEIGMRFLVDPNFKVKLNNTEITFEDVPKDHIEEIRVIVKDVGEFPIKIIDIQATDKTTQLHGIAWQVKNRLVGECTWKGSGSEHLVDGRKSIAKRYIFIVNADCLENSVLADWTSFRIYDEAYKKASMEIYKEIKNHVLNLSKSQRDETFKDIENNIKPTLRKMGIVGREKWEKFVKEVQEECPSIGSDELEKIAALLAKLETSESKYGLIHALAAASVEDLNDLNKILEKWDIDLAKVVLDEIEWRTKLLEKLQEKVLNETTDEVQELQPLFHRGLWIFGPEYETIEYTSNKGMTQVIQKIFGADIKGSTIRPDFVVLPNSTVGLYSLPKYDNEDFGEIGVDRLVVVELKRPGVSIGRDEKGQSWKYVKELFSHGLLKDYSKVVCFVLGSNLDPLEAGRTNEMDGRVTIIPMEYDMVIRRAQSRLFNLSSKIKQAPFLKESRMKVYLNDKAQLSMF